MYLSIQKCCLVINFVAAFLIHANSAYRILGVFPHIGKSHSHVFNPLLKELAERGHEVTSISHFPLNDPPKTYKDISLRGSIDLWFTNFTFDMFSFPWGVERILRHVLSAVNLFKIGQQSCEAMLKNDQVKAIREGDYDVVLIEQFNSDCGLGIAYKVKAPFIGISSHVLFSWTYGRLGLIENPSFVPSHYLEYGRSPNWWQTTEALLLNNWYKFVYYFFQQIPERNLLNEYGYNLPALEDVAKNMSLMLINTYYPLSGVTPLPPNAVEVGGLYLQKPNNLPTDLQKFFDDSRDGVIVFSMGSMLRATSWPTEKLQAFKSAFGKLKQRVLWKWEDDHMEGAPANVKLAKWIPQFDALHHENVVAFISHAGMLGISEAVHCGVPTIAIPIYGDQFGNAAMAEDAGVGTVISYRYITEQAILDAVNFVLDPRTQDRAKKVAQIWKDRPMSGLDTAVYWIEHVAEHGGQHLRSVAADLPLYRYLLLDVYALLILVTSICLYIPYKCCKMSCKRKSHKLKTK